MIEHLHEPGHQLRRTFENRPAQVGEPIEHAADVEEKENELPYVRSAGNGSVQGLQTAGRAVVHPKTAATVVAWQSFTFLFTAVIAGLSQPRRLLGPVFDDAEVTFMLGWIMVKPFLKPSACGSFRR